MKNRLNIHIFNNKLTIGIEGRHIQTDITINDLKNTDKSILIGVFCKFAPYVSISKNQISDDITIVIALDHDHNIYKINKYLLLKPPGICGGLIVEYEQ